MNKDLIIQRRTESSGLDESVRVQVAQISCLEQERVIKTVIKYGNERDGVAAGALAARLSSDPSVGQRPGAFQTLALD